MLQIGEQVIFFALLAIFLQFVQSVLYGTITALGQQSRAIVIDFIAYFLLALPLAYLLAFGVLEGKAAGVGETVAQGERMLVGLRGVWTGLVCGCFLEICCYLVLIYCVTKWGKIAED